MEQSQKMKSLAANISPLLSKSPLRPQKVGSHKNNATTTSAADLYSTDRSTAKDDAATVKPAALTHSAVSRPKITSKRRQSRHQKSTFDTKKLALKTVLPTSPSVHQLDTPEVLQAVQEEEEIEAEAEAGPEAEAEAEGETTPYDDTEPEWYYIDDANESQGPYDGKTLVSWDEAGYLEGRLVCNWRFLEGGWSTMEEARPFFIAKEEVNIGGDEETTAADEAAASSATSAATTATTASVGNTSGTSNNTRKRLKKMYSLSPTESNTASTLEDLLSYLSLAPTATLHDVAAMAVNFKKRFIEADQNIQTLETELSKLQKLKFSSSTSSATAATPATPATPATTTATSATSATSATNDTATTSPPKPSPNATPTRKSPKTSDSAATVSSTPTKTKTEGTKSTPKTATKTVLPTASNTSISGTATSTPDSTTLKPAIKRTITKTTQSSDGGGEESEFRTKLRRKSVAIKNRRKSIVVRTNTVLDKTDLTIVQDHKGNEIRFHGDGRVRISSKTSTDVDSVAQTPDVASFELKEKDR